MAENHDTSINSPAEMMQMFRAFQVSRILLTAYELEVFTIIDGDPLPADTIAKKIKGDRHAVERLMNALVGLGYVTKHNEAFANTDLTSKFLVKGKPAYMSGLGHTNNLWQSWSKLTDTVLTGVSAYNSQINDRDPAWLRNFIYAMHSRGVARAQEISPLIDFSDVKSVIDIGGGSGVFVSTFVRDNNGMTGVVFDLPNVLPITKEFIAKENLQGRVSTKEGDYLKDDLGSGYDLAFLSAVIHSNSVNENKHLIKKCYNALNDNGRIAILDYVMNDDRTEPVSGAMFAINMLVATEHGDTFTENEITSWLGEAGFREISVKEAGEGNKLVFGKK